MKDIKGSILVIDDNEINRKYVKTVLRNLDRTVHLAEDGFRGLEIAQSNAIDLALIDIQMPRMDGFECHDRLRKELGYEIPILAITAFSESNARDKFIRYGFNDYIAKPVKPDVLKNIVQYWLVELNEKASLNREENHADYDFKIIEELKRYAKPDELLELYNEFIEETKISYQKLLFLQSADDRTEILSILHVIKGNAGSLGFAKLSEVVVQLESDLKNEIDISLSERINEIADYSSNIFSDYTRQLNLNL